MYDSGTSSHSSGAGWPALWGAVIGGVGGYLVGRNNGFGGCNAPAATMAWNGCNTSGGCQTCFQQGEYTGENRAGINFIAQKVTNNEDQILAVNANVNAQFAALRDQKIADLMAEKAALQTQAVVSNTACITNNKLDLIVQALNGITTGCAVRSVPACPSSCCGQ